jgi:hypothetical protein
MLLQHGGWGISAQDLMPVGVWDTLKPRTPRASPAKESSRDPARHRGVHAAEDEAAARHHRAVDRLHPEKIHRGHQAEEPRRLLHEIELIEISLVTFPANGKARVTNVKSADFTERDFERLMQDAGLSRSEARVVINHGFKHLKAMQDAGSPELSDLAAAIKRNTELLLQHT